MLLILNLKTYAETSGDNLLPKLAAVSSVLAEYPQLADQLLVTVNSWQLALAKDKFPRLQYVAQHIDDEPQGKTTGWLPAAALKQIGVGYTLLNHSEHRLPEAEIKQIIEHSHAYGIKVILCCEGLAEAARFLNYNTFALTLESPKLIGSGQSITTQTEMLQKFVELCETTATLPMAGAGISDGNDVQELINLGGKGAILASAFALSEDPEATLRELVAPLLAA